MWDLWNGICSLAIFRITLLQTDWCLFHYIDRSQINWLWKNCSDQRRPSIVFVHFKFLRICSIGPPPWDRRNSTRDLWNNRSLRVKNWHCLYRKSTNALQTFLLCKYTYQLMVSQFSFVKTHTNTQKKKWNYPCMIMRLKPHSFCRNMFEKQQKVIKQANVTRKFKEEVVMKPFWKQHIKNESRSNQANVFLRLRTFLL